MIKKSFIAVLIIFVLASCSSTKPVASTAHKPAPVKPISNPPATTAKKNDVKFLDQISADPSLASELPEARTEERGPNTAATTNKSNSNTPGFSALQLKYAGLLGTDPSQLEITELLRAVDEWYGTRYKMGGEGKNGIDCSAFVQTVYLSAFGLTVPRTAVEQFKVCNHISATEMREGDLVFFNTTGGVSHVGIYLRNNKFVHASVARGVTVSDLFDPYYLRRFLGVGRIEKPVGTR
jgi:lipoprotein Spr